MGTPEAIQMKRHVKFFEAEWSAMVLNDREMVFSGRQTVWRRRQLH